MTSTIVKLATSRERPAVRACADCRFAKWDGFWEHYKCMAYGGRDARGVLDCKDCVFEPIPPRPPRRSLRAWFMDTFWKMEAKP